jgi:DNA-binding NarL/FixJ family response regulator
MTGELIKIGLVDDHFALRNVLATTINGYGGFIVSIVADNGKDFIAKLTPSNKPQILILDLNMPEMDGYATNHWLETFHADIKILIFTMNDTESLIQISKSKISGIIKKDISPDDLKQTLRSLSFPDSANNTLLPDPKSKKYPFTKVDKNNFSEKEITFLKWLSTNMTFEQIAKKMDIDVDEIILQREILYTKLNVKSRVSLVRYALKNGISKMEI